ncbi:MAG: FliH/SctL family protein [Lachnospiraceae bacterium]|nr:FliH/SctL family protein [Lachnospiraceae bacterium]
MKSLFKKSALLRAGSVVVDSEDVRIIDSNERLNEKMEVWGQHNRDLTGYDSGDENDEFSFTGLNPEQVEGLFGDDTVIKAEAGESGGELIDDGNSGDLPAESTPEDLSIELINQAEERLSAARLEAENILVSAQAEANYAKQSAIEEGSEQGYREGLAKAMGEIEAMKAELNEEKIKLRLEFDQLVDELEPRFVEMITDIYEQVFRAELKDRAQIVAYLAANAMRESGESKSFIIRVSPEDYPYLEENREKLRAEASLGQANIEIIKDQTLAAGDCLIETGGGVFDAGFDTQLAGLNEKLRLLSYERG